MRSIHQSLRDLTATVPRRRVLLWGTLFVLLAVAQALLVFLTLEFESSRTQERVDSIAAGVAGEIKHRLVEDARRLQAFANQPSGTAEWREGAMAALLTQREILRVEQRDPQLVILNAVDSPFRDPLFVAYRRDQLDGQAEAACTTARHSGEASYSHSYFVPTGSSPGGEMVDLCIPRLDAANIDGYLVVTMSLGLLLETVESPALAREYEVSFIEGGGERLARNGPTRGTGLFVADRIVDVPGHALQLHVDSVAGKPRLIPNLATALVLGLSLLLFALVIALARDVRKRARTETALAESLALRKAMEDLAITGLKACDRNGRVTYVNQAFCRLVGYDVDELIGQPETLYWPAKPDPSTRQVVASMPADASAARGVAESPDALVGREALFVRKDGEPLVVMLYESALPGGSDATAGWMCTVLDMTAQRRVEEMSRRQQERLHATARLATMGEMASLLSHELNQPLSAIASYASGSINLLDDAARDAESRDLLRQATHGIAEQAERAGRIIKSVHDFVRRREQSREAVPADRLIDSILPLVRLQARRSGAAIEVDVDPSAPPVLCDRTMIEQVLLNLTRNGIQAMEVQGAGQALTLQVRQSHPQWVRFTVTDRGPGIPQDAVARLFTPFYTTRSDGMGLGLSLCRTVIEQHGGALEFENLHEDGVVTGASFRFTLPSAAAERRAASIEPPTFAHRR